MFCEVLQFFVIFFDFSNTANEINRLKIVVLGICRTSHAIHLRMRREAMDTFMRLVFLSDKVRALGISYTEICNLIIIRRGLSPLANYTD
jgi:hypothetical protein